MPTSSTLLLEGLLKLKSDSFFGGSERFFFKLEGFCLNYYKDASVSDRDPIGTIPILNCEISRNGDMMAISTPHRTFKLYGRSPGETLSWLRALSKAQSLLRDQASDLTIDPIEDTTNPELDFLNVPSPLPTSFSSLEIPSFVSTPPLISSLSLKSDVQSEIVEKDARIEKQIQPIISTDFIPTIDVSDLIPNQEFYLNSNINDDISKIESDQEVLVESDSEIVNEQITTDYSESFQDLFDNTEKDEISAEIEQETTQFDNDDSPIQEEKKEEKKEVNKEVRSQDKDSNIDVVIESTLEREVIKNIFEEFIQINTELNSIDHEIDCKENIKEKQLEILEEITTVQQENISKSISELEILSPDTEVVIPSNQNSDLFIDTQSNQNDCETASVPLFEVPSTLLSPIKSLSNSSEVVVRSSRRSRKINLIEVQKPTVMSNSPTTIDKSPTISSKITVDFSDPDDVIGFFSSKRGQGTLPSDVAILNVGDLQFNPSSTGWILTVECRPLLNVNRFPPSRQKAAQVVPIPSVTSDDVTVSRDQSFFLRRDQVSGIWEIYSTAQNSDDISRALRDAQSNLIVQKSNQRNQNVADLVERPLLSTSIDALVNSDPSPLISELLEIIASLHDCPYKIETFEGKIGISSSSKAANSLVQSLFLTLSNGLAQKSIDYWHVINESKLPAIRLLIDEAGQLTLPRMPKFEQPKMRVVLLLRLALNTKRMAVLVRALAADVAVLSNYFTGDASLRTSDASHLIAIADMLDNHFDFRLTTNFDPSQDVSTVKIDSRDQSILEEPFKNLLYFTTKLLTHLQLTSNSLPNIAKEPHDPATSSLVRGGICSSLWSLMELGLKPMIGFLNRNSVWRLISDFDWSSIDPFLPRDIYAIKTSQLFSDENQRFRAFICICLEHKFLASALSTLYSNQNFTSRYYYPSAQCLGKVADSVDRLIGILEPLSLFDFSFIFDFEARYLDSNGNLKNTSNDGVPRNILHPKPIV
ncbi:hypothetical protein RCL1_001429 [Eukaryota sp. TZLM3-RCL]